MSYITSKNFASMGGTGGTGGGSGDTYTLPARYVSVLDQMSYTESTGIFKINGTLKSGLESIGLGDVHLNSSWGQDIGWKNLISGYNWSVGAWNGFIPMETVNWTNGSNISFGTSQRVYESLIGDTTNWDESTEKMDFIYQLPSDVIFASLTVRIDFHIAEDYKGRLRIVGYDKEGGTPIHSHTWEVDAKDGDEVEVILNHPVANNNGDNLWIEIKKVDSKWKSGDLIKAYRGVNVPMNPACRFWVLPYEDRNYTTGTDVISADHTLHTASQFEVDTTNGGVTITVPVDFMHQFEVRDRLETFGTNSCKIDFSAFGARPNGQGIAELRVDRDSFRFYCKWDNATRMYVWYYKDLLTGKGGVV